jgi:hypothetical protein
MSSVFAQRSLLQNEETTTRSPEVRLDAIGTARSKQCNISSVISSAIKEITYNLSGEIAADIMNADPSAPPNMQIHFKEMSRATEERSKMYRVQV